MSTVDDIRARLDIVDVVSGYVPDLKRAGSSYKARCPFHQENTPSFVVFPTSQSWRCFGGCATGGDMFSFVMRTENTDFSGAMRLLAAQAGVRIQERRERQDDDPLYSLNNATQQFFRQSLVAERGAQARAYIDGRHIGEEAVARFGVGYAPSTGGELLRSLRALGFGDDLLLRSGLVLRGDDGSPSRDMFRGRLMFPLRDVDGRIAGFAGRSLDGSDPKYINTPQTSVFDKGRMLYALDRARQAIGAEGEAVVVEGYMDVIAAHEHGYRNVVASMGTALTETQVSLLKARAQRIVLALDADAAGQEAMLQSLRTTWELVGSVAAGRRRTEVLNRPDDISSLRVALITTGKDPDELIRTDPAQWQRLLADAVPAVEFLIQAEAARVDIGSAQGKSALVERLLPVVFAVPNWADQERYFTRLAEVVGVPVTTLEAAVGRLQGPLRGQQRARRPAQPTGNRELESVLTVAEHDPLEERVLALLSQDEELLTRVAEVDPDTFVRPENRAVLFALRDAGTMEGALAQLDGQLADRLVRHSLEALPPADRKQRNEEWDGCLRRLEERRLRNLKAQEAAAFSSDAVGDVPADPDYVQAVQRQALEINERLRDIFTNGAG
ncbi:MAG: DNA primase [Chloroflexi bacterium]|nr:DNA primase [Chloroflexota bacterium]